MIKALHVTMKKLPFFQRFVKPSASI